METKGAILGAAQGNTGSERVDVGIKNLISEHQKGVGGVWKKPRCVKISFF